MGESGRRNWQNLFSEAVSLERPKFALAVTITATAVAALMRWLLGSLLQDDLPFITFFFSVIIASWAGGFRHAILASAIGAVMSVWLFMPPAFSFAVANRQHLTGLFLYALVCGAIIVLSEALRRQGSRGASGGTSGDSSAQKRAEETLRQRVEELQTLLETLPIGVFIAHDTECRTITGNRAAHQLLRTANKNLSRSAPLEERPSNFRIYRNGKELPADQLPVQRAARGEQILNEEIDDVFDDGTILHTLISANPLYDLHGNVRGAVASVLDVTKRKQTERALRESQRFLRSSLDALESHIAVLDESGNILEINEAWKQFADQNEFAASNYGVGTNYLSVCEHWAVTCEDGAEIARGICSVIDGTRMQFKAEYTCHSPVEERWFSVTATRFSDSDPIRVVVAHDNITDRKRAEEVLREADHRKNEFLATLAHELRNPLSPIRNGLQLMQLAGDDRAMIERSRIMIERQLMQLIRLVDDLMDVSRISRGKLELRRESLSLISAIDSAVETSRPLIDEMGHQLTVSIPSEPVIVYADMTRLAQVFLNLLNNAAKYTERGGHIRLTARTDGNNVQISVQDNGIGIAVPQMSKVFDLFAQIHHSLEKSQGGLGIGLSLVKRIVELHDGTIEAKSDGLGKGSEFVVTLPLQNPPERDYILPESASLPAGRETMRILIVDDNRDGANSLATMLELMGNEIRTAYDGQQGVDAEIEFNPDVILLDIGLPVLNGYEVCERIRRKYLECCPVMIAITGWGQEDDRRRSRDAGFDHHLVKPVAPAALMNLLNTLPNETRAK